MVHMLHLTSASSTARVLELNKPGGIIRAVLFLSCRSCRAGPGRIQLHNSQNLRGLVSEASQERALEPDSS